MVPLRWQQRLHDALTQEDIVDLCREFIAARTLAESSLLPAGCQPPELSSPEDVSDYAVTLIRHLGIGDRAGAPELYRLSGFFAKASLRLAQVPSRSVDLRRQG
ncbi:MAG: hypothetical protein ABIQ84_09175 [Usitatibacter sp.]